MSEKVTLAAWGKILKVQGRTQFLLYRVFPALVLLTVLAGCVPGGNNFNSGLLIASILFSIATAAAVSNPCNCAWRCVNGVCESWGI